jgi:GNAT superfamily N-acetyltransferase
VTLGGGGVSFVHAEPADADGVARVYLASFGETYDFPLAHSDDDVRVWVAEHVIPELETWVAKVDGEVVGVMALSNAVLEQLYIHPERAGVGIGSRLLELAKERRPNGLELWTFQVNAGARRFYGRHGFEEVEWTDGSGNEEGQPDVRCVWRPKP